jgi:nitrogen regulatory protein PII
VKKIEAIIKPFKVDAVKDALVELGVEGMTTMEVRGFGTQRGLPEIYRGSEYTVEFVPKTLFIVVVTNEQSAEAVEAIIKASRTGTIGDGRVFVSPVEDVIRIRTEEGGHKAL